MEELDNASFNSCLTVASPVEPTMLAYSPMNQSRRSEHAPTCARERMTIIMQLR